MSGSSVNLDINVGTYSLGLISPHTYNSFFCVMKKVVFPAEHTQISLILISFCLRSASKTLTQIPDANNVVVSDHDDIITISETECRNIRHQHINLPAKANGKFCTYIY